MRYILTNSTKDSGDDRPATLVFPATHPDGLKYLAAAHERGECVVAATSEWSSEVAATTGELLLLPYVHDTSFAAAFLNLLKDQAIGRVYAPVAAVHSWLNRFIAERQLSVRLVGESPIQREVGRFRQLMTTVTSYRGFIDDCAGDDSGLTDLEIGAVFRMADHIYGESSEEKIAAMMAIFSSAPKGDVIEIGSLAGKSASVLTLLAKRYAIGNVLAIDPWQSEAATQHDSPDTVRIHMVGEWEYEMLPKNFTINMIPTGLGCFNYLQCASENGFEKYQSGHTVTSKEFGTIEYQGAIAVIHIDGNHDYEKVKLDCKLWLPLLAQNGWLILDDYLWAHGNGPHRVGNDLLVNREAEIERSFVCGKALFVKFRPVC